MVSDIDNDSLSFSAVFDGAELPSLRMPYLSAGFPIRGGPDFISPHAGRLTFWCVGNDAKCIFGIALIYV